MIFVIDVGNTNMTMGVFCGEKLAATFRIIQQLDRKSTRLNSSHLEQSRMPSSA